METPKSPWAPRELSRERPPKIFICKGNQKLGGDAAPAWFSMETPWGCGWRELGSDGTGTRAGRDKWDPHQAPPHEPTGVSLRVSWDDSCGWEAGAVRMEVWSRLRGLLGSWDAEGDFTWKSKWMLSWGVPACSCQEPLRGSPCLACSSSYRNQLY